MLLCSHKREKKQAIINAHVQATLSEVERLTNLQYLIRLVDLQRNLQSLCIQPLYMNEIKVCP